MNQVLRTELLQMRRRDEELRAKLVAEGALFGNGYAPAMAELHREHNARLRAILQEHGWPGRDVVGDDGAAAAWLLLQHAVLDPALMRMAVPLVERAVERQQASPRHLALLVDRVCVLEGRPQIYGTSHDWDRHGQLSPLPIADPAHVDARRQQVGLEPLAENTHRIRAQAEAEGERPPADYDARQREMDAWAKAVGWRP
jgi:hypothetical protein